MTEKPHGERRLTVDFAAWLNKARIPPERFFSTGLVVLDANVLLDLYRLTPDARSQVLDAFTGIGPRLWVPHQAAVEFSRNRKHVVEDRMSSFKQVRRLLQTAAADAVTVLESAVTRLLELRERNGATRAWDLQHAALDRESLHARLAGVMAPALEELSALEAEHDLRPKDMQKVDPVLSQIDELLAGHIGPAYQPDQLRALVEEAHAFRFPNEIPPGYLDSSKETPLRASGDYLVWRQTIDKAIGQANGTRLVMLITKDFKSDWWDLDEKKRPRGPRPELVQEMWDLAQAHLLLISLKDFISGAATHLSLSVSGRTLEQLQEISGDASSLLPEIFRSEPSVAHNLLDLPPFSFEHLVHYLLIKMGYSVEVPSPGEDRGYDFWLANKAGPEEEAPVVEVKRYISPVPAAAVYQLLGAMRRAKARSAIFFTTASFTAEAREIAQDENIDLVDGELLVNILSMHGIRATVRLPNEE